MPGIRDKVTNAVDLVKNDSKMELIAEPEVWIRLISVSGVLVLEFNQPMFIDPNMPKDVLQ